MTIIPENRYLEMLMIMNLYMVAQFTGHTNWLVASQFLIALWTVQVFIHHWKQWRQVKEWQ